MDGYSANGMFREDVVIFVAEGIMSERPHASVDEAIVAPADVAVARGVSLGCARTVIGHNEVLVRISGTRLAPQAVVPCEPRGQPRPRRPPV